MKTLILSILLTVACTSYGQFDFSDLSFMASVTKGGTSAPPETVEPTDYPAMYGWWKADALSLSDNDPVSSWTDSSGNGNHMTQATSTRQPTYKTGIFGSQPVVRFDGTSDKLVWPSIFATGTNYTMIYIGTVTAGSTVFGRDAQNHQLRAHIPDNTGVGWYNPGINADVAFSRAVTNLSFIAWSAASVTINLYNCMTVETRSYGNVNTIDEMGQVLSDLGSWLKGDASEVVFYTNQLSAAEIGTLYTNYFKTRFPDLP